MDARSSLFQKAYYHYHRYVLALFICTHGGNVFISGNSPPISVDEYTFQYSNGLIDFEWDTHQEPWPNFQVRLCGKLCNGTQYLTVNSPDRIQCSTYCFPCDCDATCPVYGTCCPHIDSETPLTQEDFSRVIYADGFETWSFTGNLSDHRFVDINGDSQSFIPYPELRTGLVFKGRLQCLHTCWPARGDCIYYTIATCPPSERNETLRNLCENDYHVDTISFEFLTPLTDARNGVTFKNMHCAKCNQFLEYGHAHGSNTEQKYDEGTELIWDRHLHRWEIEVECSSYQDFYQIDSEEVFIKAVFQNTINKSSTPRERCWINPQPPQFLQWAPRLCPSLSPTMSRSFVSQNNNSCSQLRPIASIAVHHMLSTLCYNLTEPAFRYTSKNNIFCHLCDDDFPFCFDGGSSSSSCGVDCDRLTVNSPLAFLLGSKSGLSYSHSETNANASESFLCNETLQWMDDEGLCQLPQCALGKHLDAIAETCDSVVSSINRLRYRVSMVFIPNRVIPVENLQINQTVRKAMDGYFRFAVGASLNIDYFVGISNSSQDIMENGHIKFVKVHGQVEAIQSMTRDTFERWYLRSSLDTNEEEPLFEFFNESRILFGKETTHTILSARYKYKNLDSAVRATILSHGDYLYPGAKQLNTSLEQELIRASSYYIRKDGLFVYKSRGMDDLIDLNPSLACPFVEVNMSSATIEVGDEVKLGFYYRGEEQFLKVSGKEGKFSIANGALRVCIDVFRSEFQKIINNLTPSSNSASTSIKLYLTFICLGISVICLIFSIVTYALFPTLRTLPGLNTMTLCICLVLSQLGLIAVSILVGRIEGWYCQLLGVLLHYSWLTSFHWMSVCCIHMFIVFNRTQSRRATPNVWRPFLKYSTYAFGVSALYIVLHVTLSEVLSNGVTFGYSSQICLFGNDSSYFAAIFSFILPLATVVLSNGGFFCFTVGKIISVRRLQGRVNSNKSRDELFTYVKLSTLTGLCWVLMILASRLDNYMLYLISIPLAALQGLFIFVSFTVNAKVKSLYLGLVGRGAGSSATTTTTTTIICDSNVQRSDNCDRPEQQQQSCTQNA